MMSKFESVSGIGKVGINTIYELDNSESINRFLNKSLYHTTFSPTSFLGIANSGKLLVSRKFVLNGINGTKFTESRNGIYTSVSSGYRGGYSKSLTIRFKIRNLVISDISAMIYGSTEYYVDDLTGESFTHLKSTYYILGGADRMISKHRESLGYEVIIIPKNNESVRLKTRSISNCRDWIEGLTYSHPEALDKRHWFLDGQDYTRLRDELLEEGILTEGR